MIESGDLIFCHGTGFVARGIQAAEWLRRGWNGASEAAGAKWNHVAIVNERLENGDYTVVQAEGRGVTDTGLLSGLGETYSVLPLPQGLDPEDVLEFARHQVGAPYGFLTDASIALTLFSPTFINVMLPGTWICSALVAESLRFAGWLHDWPDVYQVSPAQLWIAVEASL